jgi:hypothetical protein
MKTREEIITSMCYTWRHDYGLNKPDDAPPWAAGLTKEERKFIHQQMTQIFDNDIAPYMEFRAWDSYSDLPAVEDYK